MSNFALDIRAFVEKAKGNADSVVRQTVMLAAQGVVLKSPVGNPDLWKHPVKGYVGGRFRANWQFGLGTEDDTTTTEIDPSGAGTLGRINEQVQVAKAGDVCFVSNSLPYAQRLEEGWSYKQAPNGMVGLTMIDLPAQIDDYVKTLA